MPGTGYRFEVRPRLPQALARLDELAGNLFYSWDRRVRGLFHRMDAGLWDRCDHNPKVFLRRVSQERLDDLARDSEFLLQYEEVLSAFDNYLASTGVDTRSPVEGLEAGRDLVAYFCMEYGLHESLHLYSGGLGILAGDHCKAASDLDLPFVAVGLMYRRGYFNQTIDREGVQQMHFTRVDLDDLPLEPVRDDSGEALQVTVALPERDVAIRAWQVAVGRIRLYLLDTETPDNAPEDRAITRQLYGGDRSMRIAQELVLGIGGVRVLRAMGVAPTAWHVNEGHPAFSILERCRELVAGGLEFDAALEATAASTLFTTHTAVPAGHDRFSRDLAEPHLQDLAQELGVNVDRLLALGASVDSDDGSDGDDDEDGDDGSDGELNMTALALRGSRYHNGVSAVHRGVAAEIEGPIWPEIDAAENPLAHVSNGVHISTFLAREWVSLFDGRYPEWRRHQNDPDYWQQAITDIPDHRFWSLTQSLKGEMLGDLRAWLEPQYDRNNYPRLRVEAMRDAISPENTRPLVIGFARRFATYKRALLVFQDIERLGRLLNNPERPVIMLFAGKAHPQDMPGQALIRRVHEFASRPPCLNRVFLLEGYDMALARKLVTGVDVWLNTPEYPLEASGTSGQKAAMNGVINLSVLDGWWAEGFDGDNGWGVRPHGVDLPPEQRDAVEAEDLLDRLEYEVIPEYYRIGSGGYSPEWMARSKRSMYSVLPRFNAERMVIDYATRFYAPASQQGRALGENEGAAARELAQWKARVCECWPGVQLTWAQAPPTIAHTGASVGLRVAAELNGLAPDDVVVEGLLTPSGCGITEDTSSRYVFSPGGVDGDIFELDLVVPDNGLFHLYVRMYPHHALLVHRFEMGRMVWLEKEEEEA